MYGAEKTRRIAALWILVSIVSVAGARAGQTAAMAIVSAQRRWPDLFVGKPVSDRIPLVIENR